MRLYDANTCTPAASRNGEKWTSHPNMLQSSALQQSAPVVAATTNASGETKGGTRRRVVDYGRSIAYFATAAKPHASSHFHRPGRSDIVQSATSATSLTSGSSPPESELRALCNKAVVKTKQSKWNDNSDDSSSSEPFHFDIELVKSNANQSVHLFEEWGDEDKSKESSSTLSTGSLHARDEVRRVGYNHHLYTPGIDSEAEKESGIASHPPFAPGSVEQRDQHSAMLNSGGWDDQLFWEKDHVTPLHSLIDARSHPDDVSWVNFTADSFKPIHKPPQPPKPAATVTFPNLGHSQSRTQSVRDLVRIHHGKAYLPEEATQCPETREAVNPSIDVTQQTNRGPAVASSDRIVMDPYFRNRQPQIPQQGPVVRNKPKLRLMPHVRINRLQSSPPPNASGTETDLMGSQSSFKREELDSYEVGSKEFRERKFKPNVPRDCSNSKISIDQPKPLRAQTPFRKAMDIERALCNSVQENTSPDVGQVLSNLHRGTNQVLNKPTRAKLPDEVKPSRRTDEGKPFVTQVQQFNPIPPTNADLKGVQLNKPSSEAIATLLGQRQLRRDGQQHALTEPSSAIPPEQPSLNELAIEPAVMSDDKFIESLNEDPNLSKYARMLKVGLPIPVIRNAMARDGVKLSIEPQQNITGTKQNQASTQVDPVQRFRLHWETHSNVRSNTMWAMIGQEEHWLQDIVLEEEEMTSLFEKERFRSTQTKSKSSERTSSNTSDSATGANAMTPQVVDPKRANNCGIILARIKLTYREIAVAVDTMNEKALSIEQIEGISPFIPTEEESRAFRTILESARPRSGRHHSMFRVECEKFMVEMMQVENAKQKLEAMLFMKRLPICMDQLKTDARLIQTACAEVMTSSSLRKILGLVLHVGNSVNASGKTPTSHGTRNVGASAARASAIQLSSLLKLQATKTYDRRTSFLEYVGRIVRRHYPKIWHNYRSELGSLPSAAAVQWIESVQELYDHHTTLAELRQMALPSSHATSTKSESKATSSESLRYDMPTDNERSQLMTTTLGRYVLGASSRLASAKQEIIATNTLLDQLLQYFGESSLSDSGLEEESKKPIATSRTASALPNGKSGGKHASPAASDFGAAGKAHQILNILAQFCNDLDVALERAGEYEKAKSRELRPKKTMTMKTTWRRDGPIQTMPSSGNHHRTIEATRASTVSHAYPSHTSARDVPTAEQGGGGIYQKSKQLSRPINTNTTVMRNHRSSIIPTTPTVKRW